MVKNNQGFTLLELIISLTFGLILLSPILILPIQSYSTVLQIQKHLDYSNELNSVVLQINKDIASKEKKMRIEGDKIFFNDSLYYEIGESGIIRVENTEEDLNKKVLFPNNSSFRLINNNVLEIDLISPEETTPPYKLKFNLNYPLDFSDIDLSFNPEVPILQPPDLPEVGMAFNLSDIEDVFLGEKSSLWLTKDNDLFVVGSNYYGNLGINENETINGKLLVKNVDMVYSSDSTTFLIKNNKVYAFGRNDYGQLGLGHTNNVSEPTVVQSLSNMQILKIVPTPFNTFVLTNKGEIYSFGLNNYGQLGLGHKKTITTPTKITALNSRNIVDVKSKGLHSLAIDSGGNVYGWGRNDYGQVQGISQEIISPVSIGNLPKIIEIEAEMNHSMALGVNNKLYVWGDNKYGQLGLGKNISYIINPVENRNIPFKGTLSFHAGDYHSFVVDNKLQIYAFGKNDNGQLGLGNTNHIFLPQMIQFPQNVHIHSIKTIKTNDRNTIIVSNNKNIYVSGNNEKNQILLEDMTSNKFVQIR